MSLIFNFTERMPSRPGHYKPHENIQFVYWSDVSVAWDPKEQKQEADVMFWASRKHRELN